MSSLRVVAILATYNEERFIGACLQHLVQCGVETYVIDNESTDRTVSIAESYKGRGVIGIEAFPRHGQYSWKPILQRKEHLAATLEADWLMHLDADEIRLPLRGHCSFQESFAEVEAHGDNAVNFFEHTFVPTRESPSHDHADFQRTMRWYYPFAPTVSPANVKAWKRQSSPVDLASSGGHHVQFLNLRIFPQFLSMRHYLFLSESHAIAKYVDRRYDPLELEAGWHRQRASLRSEMVMLPSQAELRPYLSDDELDATNPRSKHFLFDHDWISQQRLS